MGAAIFNMVIGVVLVVAALGFDAVLLFTDSHVALAAAGGVIFALGVYQAIRVKRQGG